MMKNFSTFNPEAQEWMEKGYSASETLLAGVLEKVGEAVKGEGTHKLFAAMMLAAAPLKYMATAIANGEEAEDKIKVAGKETMLIAALAVARCMIPVPGQFDQLVSNFTPRNFLAAVETASQIAGRDLKPMLDANMLAEYQRGCDEENLTLGYWDYIDDIVPNFDNFGEDIAKFAKNFTEH